MSDENYVKAKGAYQNHTAGAVLVLFPDREEPDWIPFSLLHGGDVMLLERRSPRRGDPVSLRMMAWKAAKLGLDK